MAGWIGAVDRIAGAISVGIHAAFVERTQRIRRQETVQRWAVGAMVARTEQVAAAGRVEQFAVVGRAWIGRL